MTLYQKYFDKALLVFVACLPLYVIRFSIIKIPTTFIEVFLGILFIAWLIKNYQGIVTRFKQNIFAKRLHNRYPFDWELILWLLISLTAVVTAGFSFSALGLWRAYFFEPSLAFILFINTFNTKEKILKSISALAYSSITLGLISAYQYLTGDFIPNESWAQLAERRATSLFPYPNAVGLYLAPLACLFAGAFLSVVKENRRRASLYLVAFVVSLIAILLARSDGALFAVAATLFVMLFLSNIQGRLVALGLAAAVALGIWFSPPLRGYVIDRASLKDFSGQIRRFQWRETLVMLNDGRVMSGVGLAKYQDTIIPYHQKGFFFNKEKLDNEEFVEKIKTDKAFRDSHWQPLEIYLYPHNFILNFWVELGLLGVLLFVWIILRFLWQSIKSYFSLLKAKDPTSFIFLGLFGAMLAIVVHGLVDVPYLKNDLAIIFWLLVALLGILNINKKK